MVAATGGHLAELVRLSPRLVDLPHPRLWVTFDNVQSRTLLEGQDVIYVPFTAPRDLRAVAQNTANARRIYAGVDCRSVVSTGSAIATAFMPAARLKGIECFYVECSARTHGPSLTGRILSAVPGVRRYTQFEQWARRGWQYRGSVFDSFVPSPLQRPAPERLRVVVTVGTLAFSFRRLFARLAEILPSDAEVLWQTGQTPVDGLPLDARPFVPPDELDAAMRRADVVIAHAGIGSALAALDAGRPPVLVPRLREHGEHVDDHQLQIAESLSARGIAWTSSVEGLTLDLFLRAANQRVDAGAGSPISLR